MEYFLDVQIGPDKMPYEEKTYNSEDYCSSGADTSTFALNAKIVEILPIAETINNNLDAEITHLPHSIHGTHNYPPISQNCDHDMDLLRTWTIKTVGQRSHESHKQNQEELYWSNTCRLQLGTSS